MHTLLKKLLVITTLSVLTAGLAAPAFAADDGKDKKDQPTEGKKKGGGIPFQGKISAVDKAAMTITLKGKENDRVFNVTSQTKLWKAGKPATLEDATVGENATGQYKKGEGDKLDAVVVYIGPRPEKKKKDDTK